MANIFKAFMYDLRTDGFIYAVKSTVREFNPYAQLRDARAWIEDQRETIEALAQEVVQLEAQLEATKYVFVTGNDRPEHVTPRSWRYAYCPPPTPTLDEWMEGADLSVPTEGYEPREAAILLLDEWMTPADREALTRTRTRDARKLLHSLLETKRPRKNKNR